MRLHVPLTRWSTVDALRFSLLLALMVLIKIAAMVRFPLTGDEAYHWEWSRRLAPAYYDHPGAVAWAIALTTRLTGVHSEWSVRLPALIAMTLAALVARRLARRLAQDQGWDPPDAEYAGAWAGLIVALAPVYTVLSIYMSTDPPLLLFWMLALDFGYRAFRDNRLCNWLGMGLAMALAMDSKFLGYLLAPAAGLALLLTADGRRRLRTAGPWIAALAVLVGVAPVLLWNWQHDWATFRFNLMIRQTAAIRSLSLYHLLEYGAGQVLALSPGVALLGVAALRRMARRQPFWACEGATLFLWVSAVLPIGLFLLVSLTRRVGIHWPAAGWLSAIVLAAVEEGERRPPSAIRSPTVLRDLRSRAMAWAWGFFLVLLLAAWGLYLLGPFTKPVWLSEWNTVYGWRDLGRRVAEEQKRLTAESGTGTVLFARSYAMAAQVAFYTPGHPIVALWAPPAVHGQEYRRWDRFDRFAGSNVLLIARSDIARVMPAFRAHCAAVSSPEPLEVTVGGIPLRMGEWARGVGFDGRTPDWSNRPHAAIGPMRFSGKRAFEEVASFVSLGPRPAGSVGMEKAARHVAGRLEAMGLSVTMDVFEDVTPFGQKTFRNVEAVLPGRSPGRVLLLSHMDTKAGIADDFVGANDSGSSTGFLIELARTLLEQGWEGPSIHFLFVDGEECQVEYGPRDGLHGSRYAAARWKQSPLSSQVKAVIVLDMMGDRDLTLTIPRNGDPALIRALFKAAEREGLRSHVRLHRQTILDDHVPFLDAGFPALALMDFEYGHRPGCNDYWHTPKDTMDKLAPESLEIVGRLVLRLLHDLAGHGQDPESSASASGAGGRDG